MTAKSSFRLASCALILSTIILSGFSEIPVASAAPPTVGKQTNPWDKIVFLANEAWQKISGKRQAGVRQTRIAAGRGKKSDLVALVPVVKGDFVGVAITDQPTFWFYISPTASELNLKSMKFVLRNQQNEELWSTKLSMNNPKIDSGLMPITYKGDQLKTNGIYFWELSYQQTDPQRGVSEHKLLGNLQKETFPSLSTNQKTLDRISTYARNGIWHELITELIIKKQQNPHDQQLANAFRTLIFESPDVKYLEIDEKKDDIELMERIITAKVLSLRWSN